MKQVNIHYAKTHLSGLLSEVEQGEEIIVAKAGKPIARLVPYVALQEPRQLGLLAGQVVEQPGCWEADDELEASFYGGPIEPPGLLSVADSAGPEPYGQP